MYFKFYKNSILSIYYLVWEWEIATVTVEELESAFRYMVDQHLADLNEKGNRQNSHKKAFLMCV